MAVKIKLKTNKSCKRRYKKTANGSFLAKQAGIKHLNSGKRRKLTRKLSRHRKLNDVNAKRLKDLLPYA
jgi:ribosomal protein L35